MVEGLEVTPIPLLHGEDYICQGFVFGTKQRVAYLSDVSRIPEDTLALLRSKPMYALAVSRATCVLTMLCTDYVVQRFPVFGRPLQGCSRLLCPNERRLPCFSFAHSASPSVFLRSVRTTCTFPCRKRSIALVHCAQRRPTSPVCTLYDCRKLFSAPSLSLASVAMPSTPFA
jgi:hypothetical protein